MTATQRREWAERLCAALEGRSQEPPTAVLEQMADAVLRARWLVLGRTEQRPRDRLAERREAAGDLLTATDDATARVAADRMLAIDAEPGIA